MLMSFGRKMNGVNIEGFFGTVLELVNCEYFIFCEFLMPNDMRRWCMVMWLYVVSRMVVIWCCRIVVGDDGTIRTGDARQGLLSGMWRTDDGDGEDGDVKGIHVLHPVPQIDISVQHCVANKNATTAIVAGPSMGDPEITQVLLLDLAARGGSSGMNVPMVELDEELFGKQPGLRVVDMAWHPDSERHFVILTSDGVLRIYDLTMPSLAEQTFELKSHRRLSGLDDDWNEAYPMSFVFGDGEGWNKLCVYILMSTGAICTLCPVAPFGAMYSKKWLNNLWNYTRDDKEQSNATTDSTHLHGAPSDAIIWLQKAFPSEALDEPSKALVLSRPHAMESHVPLLSPPFQCISNDTKREIDHVQPGALMIWHAGPHTTVLTKASTTGTVHVGIITSDVKPIWNSSPPQCIFKGNDIVAVRSQCCPSVTLGTSSMEHTSWVLIDEIILPNGSKNTEEIDSDIQSVNATRIGISLDTASPATLIVCQQQCIHSITLPWVSLLHSYSSSKLEIENGVAIAPEIELPDVLPFPLVEEIVQLKDASPIISYALVGDKLSGSAVVMLQANGEYNLKRIKIGTSAKKATLDFNEDISTTEKLEEDVQQRIRDHITSVYNPILKGPLKIKKQAIHASEAADSPHNYKVLVETIKELRSSHIEFCHKAHLVLKERVEFLESELQQQIKQAKKLQESTVHAESKGKKCDTLKEQAVLMAQNIEDRIKLLAELHWAVPRPPSDAEREFKAYQLPMLERNTAALAEEVSMLCAQAALLKKNAEDSNKRGWPMRAATQISPQQLRKIREMLMEHDEIIRNCCRKAEAIEARLHEEDREERAS